eukprot:sb/3478835/
MMMQLPSAVKLNAGYFPGQILTNFLLTDKLLGYFPVNLDQFAASGKKRDVNRSSGSSAKALERYDPILGGGAVAWLHGSLSEIEVAQRPRSISHTYY